MKIITNYLVVSLLFSFYAIAGDYRYEWANIGQFGLGEISNQLLIYCGDDICFTSIPAFESYWKWYLLCFVIIAFIVIVVRRKNRNRS